jgi:alpha-L-rhamnosidase
MLRQISLLQYSSDYCQQSKHNPRVQGLFLFRKEFDVDAPGEEFIVHVSADNRYQLYVKGIAAGSGPAQSVPAHWNFETFNIAPC